jgi:hypothetical protein
MSPLVLTLAVLLQQPQAPQRPAPAAPVSREAATNETRQAIVDVGRSVAEMRTAHDALRRAVFNFPDAVVVQRARDMRERCRALDTTARAAVGHVCRSCFSTTVQPAMNRYRAALPGVGQVGTRCATQLAQQLRAPDPAAAVRRDIWSLDRTVVNGLFPYEDRVLAVRQALGLVGTPPPTPRR